MANEATGPGLRARLTPEQYPVMQEQRTERLFTGEHCHALDFEPAHGA